MLRLLVLLVSFYLAPSRAISLNHPSLVDRFYANRHQARFWFVPGAEADSRRRELLSCIDSAAWKGLDSLRYQPDELREKSALVIAGTDSLELMNWDRRYTDMAIGYIMDLYQGAGFANTLSYDGVSPHYAEAGDSFILDRLACTEDGVTFRQCTDSLEPPGPEFAALRLALGKTLEERDGPGRKEISAAMNAHRWIHHFRFDRFIVVNIASATLRYYTADSLKLSMKIVAGQSTKRTPRFAAWCDQIILYPYWNVPHKIVVNELLPIFKKSPALVEVMDMQILDGRGKVVEPQKLSWAAYNKNNFSYGIRQLPGCDNALGVIKFNLSSPFAVYMHDTNQKSAFSSSSRYFSHGCIRLEKPFELGMELLQDKLDTVFLRSCLKDQQPYALSLADPVPVFVLYLRAEADTTGQVRFFKDIYRLGNSAD